MVYYVVGAVGALVLLAAYRSSRFSRNGSFDASDLGFDFFDEDAESPPAPPSRVALETAKRGDVVSVGGTKWVAYGDYHFGGGMLPVYKVGTKGTKSYYIHVSGDLAEVYCTEGTRTRVDQVAASGPLRLTGETAKV